MYVEEGKFVQIQQGEYLLIRARVIPGRTISTVLKEKIN